MIYLHALCIIVLCIIDTQVILQLFLLSVFMVFVMYTVYQQYIHLIRNFQTLVSQRAGLSFPFAHCFTGDLSYCILLNQYLAKQCVYKIPTNRHNLLGTNNLQHQISTHPTMQRCKSPDREDPVSPSNAAGEALAAHAQEVKKCTKFHQISGVIHAKDVRTSVYMSLKLLVFGEAKHMLRCLHVW